MARTVGARADAADRKGWASETVLGTIAAAELAPIAMSRRTGSATRARPSARVDVIGTGRQFRHHDQIVPGWPRRAGRRHCRAAFAAGLTARLMRWSIRRACWRGCRRTARRSGNGRSTRRQGWHIVAHGLNQALSDLLRHPPLDRCRARSGGAPRSVARQDRGAFMLLLPARRSCSCCATGRPAKTGLEAKFSMQFAMSAGADRRP